jgi:hypothetical protein
MATVNSVKLNNAFWMPVLLQGVNQSQKTISTGNISVGIYVTKAYP